MASKRKRPLIVHSWEKDHVWERPQEDPPGAESAQIFAAIAESKKVSINDSVYIWNPMPYATAIEEGLGKGDRVAHRMVAKAVALAKANLNAKVK